MQTVPFTWLQSDRRFRARTHWNSHKSRRGKRRHPCVRRWRSRNANSRAYIPPTAVPHEVFVCKYREFRHARTPAAVLVAFSSAGNPLETAWRTLTAVCSGRRGPREALTRLAGSGIDRQRFGKELGRLAAVARRQLEHPEIGVSGAVARIQ